jgi:hypothetical protein
VEAVPTTTAGVHLAGLDINDIKHPKLKQLSEATTLTPTENPESCAEEAQSQHIGSDPSLPVSPVSISVQGESARPQLDGQSRRSSLTEIVAMQDEYFLMNDISNYQEVDERPVDAPYEERNRPGPPSTQQPPRLHVILDTP